MKKRKSLPRLSYVPIYTSEQFDVISVEDEIGALGVEIVHRPPEGGYTTMTYLTGPALATFCETARGWQRDVPFQLEVEQYLAGRVYLAPQYPMNLH